MEIEELPEVTDEDMDRVLPGWQNVPHGLLAWMVTAFYLHHQLEGYMEYQLADAAKLAASHKIDRVETVVD